MYLPAPTEGGNFAPCPAGTFLAVCYRVVDLGTQQTTYQGENKTAHKVMLSWELPEERMEDGRPFTISKRYTWSMHEKSTLRKHLEAWRGAAFSEKDFGPNGFDIKNVLGKACILSIVQETKDGKTYSNITSVGKPMKGMAMPNAENPTVYLWIHDSRWDAATFNALSAGLQETIRGTPEYAEMLKARDGDGGLPYQSNGDIHEDDIPF
jgi:hypothetical protein